MLYQHFPSKQELYLALLDESIETLVGAVRSALGSTGDNHQRVAAAIGAYFDFVDDPDGAYRLVFESDLVNVEEVRRRVERADEQCAALVAQVIVADAGLSEDEAMLLATRVDRYGPDQRPALVAQPSRAAEGPGDPADRRAGVGRRLRFPQPAASRIPARAAQPRPASRTAKRSTPPQASRRLRLLPRVALRCAHSQRPQEVCRGGPHRGSERRPRHRLREQIDQDEVTKAVAKALADNAVLTLNDDKGRQYLVPADKIAYVELGESTPRRVGFGAS